jgi:hypothetical protein
MGSQGAERRMQAILIMGNRAVPHELVPSDAEKAKVHSTMAAYAGTYALEGDKVTDEHCSALSDDTTAIYT